MADWIINRPKATITCSKCKARLNAKLFMDLLEAWNFCPYCGADMRAEQTEPKIAGKHTKQIIIDEAVTDPSPCIFVKGVGWKGQIDTEPQTNCSWK